jgi:hypothetical protein
MRGLIVTMLLATVAGTMAARDFEIRHPVKQAPSHVPNVPSPERQGGDTIETATIIAAMPFLATGTTSGYWNDYDEVCPYSGSVSPDVVYEFTVDVSSTVTVDLHGSGYDTKTYIYAEDMTVVCCNDDFYDDYTSYLECIVTAGRYYIVIDGYDGAHGAYALSVSSSVYLPCQVECPGHLWGLVLIENEPPLVDGYSDTWNSGCDSSPVHHFQHVEDMDWDGEHILCGESGWYVRDGLNCRDTDWITIRGGYYGDIEITAESESAIDVYGLTGDCESGLDSDGHIVSDRCEPTFMSILTDDGEEKIILIRPTTYEGPAYQASSFDYVIWFSGLFRYAVATERTSWSTVKALFVD